MNATARNAIVALALSVSGGLLAMSWAPATSANKGVGSQAFTQTDFALIGASEPVSNVSELVASVDWSKVKSESLPPTF